MFGIVDAAQLDHVVIFQCRCIISAYVPCKRLKTVGHSDVKPTLCNVRRRLIIN